MFGKMTGCDLGTEEAVTQTTSIERSVFRVKRAENWAPDVGSELRLEGKAAVAHARETARRGISYDVMECESRMSGGEAITRDVGRKATRECSDQREEPERPHGRVTEGTVAAP